MLEKKLQEEVNRYRSINKYVNRLIMEQDAPLPESPLPGAPTDGAPLPAAPTDGAPLPGAPTDGAPLPGAPTDAAPLPESDTEEMDITDLVNMSKSIKKDILDNKNDHGQVLTKMDDVFSKLTDLEQKIAQMDLIMDKIDKLDVKVGDMKEKTPQEKLEMRSLDSYPFSQNPQEFFANKQDQMRASGKMNTF
jgi:hypothetical protein